MPTTFLRAFPALASVAIMAACASPAARDVWDKGLSRCACNDTLDSKNLVFLGPSNTYGPGSGWRKADSGVLESRFSLERAIATESDRRQMVTRGAKADCSSLQQTEWAMAPTVALASAAADVEASLGLDLQRQVSVDVKVDSWRIDRLEEVEYEAWMVSPAAGKYGQDLLAKDRDARYVMKSAVAVSGFRAVIRLDATDQAALEGKLPLDGTGVDLGGSLKARRVSKDRVEISSTDEFYVVATFVAVRKGALGAFPTGAGHLERDVAPMAATTRTGRVDLP